MRLFAVSCTGDHTLTAQKRDKPCLGTPISHITVQAQLELEAATLSRVFLQFSDILPIQSKRGGDDNRNETSVSESFIPYFRGFQFAFRRSSVSHSASALSNRMGNRVNEIGTAALHRSSRGAAELLEHTVGARVHFSNGIFALAVVSMQFSLREWVGALRLLFLLCLCENDTRRKSRQRYHFTKVLMYIELRSKWLVAICRDGRAPNDSSCCTKVCSRHIKNEDFIEGKRRRLKKCTVPSIFD
ncbi:hypothetical protein HPB48_023205 [Haemaphysalis longicornis]|uniref:THAP-type domain-containing protein n=1 Tax=Haemaphysalis longicornis TaxID=44386 RepID=A0A9J6H7E5_HAELO|nr:hypothetical protein HPB48_023205 [Haemaphysalis longicornis]